MSNFFVFTITVALFASGCTRHAVETSKITIKTPVLSRGQGENNGQAAPAGQKYCYGVSVTGSGISTNSISTNSCSPKVGVLGGFVNEGAELTVEVAKGSDRVFELFAVQTAATTDCPQFSAGISAADAANTFAIGKSSPTNISSDTQTVQITVDVSGLANSIAMISTCSGNASLKAVLHSNGDLVDGTTGSLLAGSSPTTEGAFLSPFADSLAIGVLSSGGLVNMSSAAISAPPQITSITRKPDTGSFYGLQMDGQIVQLGLSGSTLTTIGISSCPFSTVDCKVPAWIQSISAGYDSGLYGLDHAGNIYELTINGPVQTGQSVGPNATQVSYY